MRRLFLVLSCCAACTTESPELAARNARLRNRDADLPFGRPDPNGSIALGRLSIQGVSIGMSEEEVRRTLGAPSNAPDPQAGGGHSYLHRTWPGLRIIFEDDRVNSVECAAPSPCATADSVRIGRSHAGVKGIYGAGFRGYAPNNDVLIYYVVGRPDCALIFDFVSGVVSTTTSACGLPLPNPDR